MRIVVLTVGGRYGVLVLRALKARGVAPVAIVLEAHPALRDCFHKRTLRGRLAELPLVPLRSAWRRLRPRMRRDLRIGAPLIVSGPRNSERMRADLARLRPDLLVLAGIGIISRDLLAIPRLGTVNVHLGLLPWVRGNDVIAHAVLRGIPVGLTCHLVDAGIDTGPILVRRLLETARMGGSLASLEEASVVAGADLLADMVAEIVKQGRVPNPVIQQGRFPLCRFLDAASRAEADALIRRGRAKELFEAWLPLASGENGVLAADITIPSVK
jgi:hypothetical protein